MASNSISPAALAFSGPIGSGKTTIASETAGALGWRFASFSSFLRMEALSRELQPTREVLRTLGLEFIDAGWERFCRGVLEDSAWNSGQGVVIDGVRHIEAMQTITTLVRPLALYLLYVKADEATRTQRLSSRSGKAVDVRELDSHETENQVHRELRRKADLELDGALESGQLVKAVISWLKGTGEQPG